MRCLPLLALMACSAEPEAENVQVKWISVFASDYDLELEPAFSPEVTRYTALADAPGIEVQVEVFLSGGDADWVRVNGLPAASSGFRTWLSDEAAQLAAPTQLEVEMQLPPDLVPAYEIEITVP